MRTTPGARLVPVLSALALMAALLLPSAAHAAQPTVNLGSTSNFAILAGTTITNTGPTTVNGDAGGDIGLFPGTDFPGQADVTLSGAVHLTDTLASQAKDDLVAAYDDAAGRTPVTTIPSQLGGQRLKPGVYASSSGTFNITGTLTLDAEGDPNAAFIFKTTSTLVTAPSSRVSLVNGARYCRVFWKVGSSATLGTDSRFVGHVFALTSISAQTRATVQGQLLARNGAVTLDTNTITNGICADVAAVPVIRIVKSADDYNLPSGGDSVTYTYKVSNPGSVALADVTVKDDKIADVKYVSGDTNEDGLLQHGETWTYTARSDIAATTTNTATATGTGGGTTVTDTMVVRVVVAPEGTPGTPGTPVTETGGQMPKTSTPWHNLLLLGGSLVLVGSLAYWGSRRTDA